MILPNCNNRNRGYNFRFSIFSVPGSIILLFFLLFSSNTLNGQEQKGTYREYSSRYSNNVVRPARTQPKVVPEANHLTKATSAQSVTTVGIAASSSIISCPSGNCNPNPKAAYLTSATYGNPWLTDDNFQAMDLAFGTGSWDSLFFETVDINVLLSGQYDVIFLDGSDFGAILLSDFLDSYLDAIEAWVFAGGSLFLNAAPNIGANIDFGFGGFYLEYLGNPISDFSVDGIVVMPGHPIFNGPAVPASGNFKGNFFSHGVVKTAGISGTVLILDSLMTGASLVELPFGNGTVLFGSMTVPFYQQPIPNAANFRGNILSYLSDKATCIQFEFETDAGLCAHTVPSDTLDATFTGNNTLDVLFHNFPNAPQTFTLEGAQLPVGVSTIVWTAVDIAGNISTCSIVVNVISNQIEVCNGLDDDCDGVVDESGGQVWYADADGDGFGDPGVDSISCNQPVGFISDNTDCNDSDALINPSSKETCNGFDDNCNGLVDDADPGNTNQPIWYADTDGDGFGDALVDSASCFQPSGFVDNNTDCDDTDATINPSANEPCNSIDDNCNGQIDETVISLIIKSSDLSCNGSADGSLSTVIFGGAPPYLYQWSNGETTADVFGLSAGSYSLTLTDNNLCSTVASVIVTEPLQLTITTAEYPVSCFGNADGYIASTVTGGVGPYSYYWSDKSETTDLDSLSAGTYDLTVTDASGCTATISVLISEPPLLSVMTTESGITCYGAGNGSASAIATGGTAPYIYLWSNGNSGASILNLFPGTYILTITDSKGCTTTGSSTISEPSNLLTTLSLSNVTCFGATDGAITTNTVGGTPPYIYQWSNGSTSSQLTNLVPGAYILTLTDNNGCSNIFSGNISQPNQLMILTNVVDINCTGNANGALSTTISGGTLPYFFQWSNGETTQSISGLAPQTYTLTLTDGNGCTETSSSVITEPAQLSFSVSEDHVSCNGGSDGTITVTCSGGTSPYSYLWSNGATDAIADYLSAGTYQLNITDDNGCSVSLTSNITEPLSLAVSTTNTPVTCNGFANGTLTATISGGTTPYFYQWSNGGSNPTTSSLTAGSYMLTVTDGNGCQITTLADITEPPPLSLIYDATNIPCNGMANGSVATLLSGGTEPYTYLWSNGGTNPLINNLVAGTYSLTVTDNNGCTSTLIASVTQPPVLLPSITTIAVACNGDASGEAAVSTAGGTPPYMFQWSNGATTTMINELTAGVYSLTITDQNQCQAIEVANITEPPPLSSIIDQVNATCIGYSDGSIDVMVTGGTTPYEYRWSTGDNQPNLDNLAAGAYSITITDSNGCSLVESMDIIEAYPLTIDPWTDRVLSLGDSLELQVVSNIGPNEVDQYTWITQTDTIQCNTCSTYSDLPLRSGCLTVFVESIYGCTESATLCFDVEALRRVYMPNVFKPNSGNDNAAVVLFSDSSVQNIKKLMFFDRWGTLLYHAENIPPNSNAAGWDGTYRGSSMAPGVYIWAAEVEFVDGKTEVFQGDVTLIR